MTDTGFTSTRRALLGAVAALPAIVALSAPALATVAIDRHAWDKTFSTMLRAKAAVDADDLRHKPIREAYRFACEAIPHTSVTIGNAPDHRILSTANLPDLSFARGLVNGAAPDNDRPTVVACRNLIAADHSRRDEQQRIGERTGYHESAETAEVLYEAYADSWGALMALPAPDAPALLWKLEFLFGEEVDSDEEGDAFCSSYTTTWMRMVMDDARRLLVGRA